MKTYNLDQEILDITNKAAIEIKAAKIKAEAFNKVPIDNKNIIVYTSSKVFRIGFGWGTPLTKAEVKAVFEAYPIAEGNNYEMKFANSGKNFETDSSLVVKWDNSHSYHFTKVFKLNYSSNDIDIEITVPVSHFGNHVYYNKHQGKHLGFGRYESFNDMFIDYFYTQSYSGGYNILYFLEGAESLEEYINFVKTGEFKFEIITICKIQTA